MTRKEGEDRPALLVPYVVVQISARDTQFHDGRTQAWCVACQDEGQFNWEIVFNFCGMTPIN